MTGLALDRRDDLAVSQAATHQRGAVQGSLQRRRFCRTAGLLALLLTAAVAMPGPSRAVALWTDPVVLFSTDQGFVSAPVMLADPENTVHLFFISSESNAPTKVRPTNLAGAAGAGLPGRIMYARLVAGRWSRPIDILATPGGAPITMTDVALDTEGYLHVIWKNGATGALEYSRAHVAEAAIGPSVWTSPQALFADPLTSVEYGAPAAITAGQNGSVHLVYATLDGNVAYRRSDDTGESWSPPVTVAGPDAPDTRPGMTRIAVSGDGSLDVTWTDHVYPSGWPPVGSFSSRSTDGGLTWGNPIRITGPNYALVNMVTTAPNIIQRVWNGVAAVGERRHQWSADGGATWSRATLVAPTSTISGGLTGYPALAIDSAGALHLATAVDNKGDIAPGGSIYYLYWDGQRWSAPEYISRGALGKHQVASPAIAISEGNRLHVTYEDDNERIWYTTRLLDAPTVSASVIPPPPVAVAPPMQPSPRPSLVSYPPQPTAPISMTDLQPTNEPAAPLLIAAICTLFLVSTIVLARATRPA